MVLFRRLTLRRTDGTVYLKRWAFGWDRVVSVYLHHITAPDPRPELHDHPWSFVSIVLAGGYTELRSSMQDACDRAEEAVYIGFPKLAGDSFLPDGWINHERLNHGPLIEEYR